MKIVNNFGGVDKEICNIGDILHKVGKNYLRAFPIVCNENGEDFEDYRIYGTSSGVGEEVDITGLSEPLCGIGAYTDSLNLFTGILTRRIKKLVITGNENWVVRSGHPENVYFIEYRSTNFIQNIMLCTHYINQDSGSFTQLEDKHCLVALSSDGIRSFIGIRDSSYKSTPAFVSYLAAQYSAGTPVTVWYALANEETAIVPIPSGLTGTLEGYLIQDGTPTPQTPIYPTANGVKQADDTYSIKYGYKLDMSVSDGTTSTTTPIYIGSSPLEANEYIDYDSGKIYRMNGGTLTPTDPPVPLPSIPTVNGKTIINYAGTGTVPEKAWFSGMEFEIEDVYFGNKHIFSVWGEYDGILPATYSANGSMLADYRIYGSSGGVGDRTDNRFDVSKIVTKINKVRQENGTIYINIDSSSISTADGNNSTLRDLIGNVPPGTYRLHANTTGSNKFIYLYGKNEPWGFNTNKTFTSDDIDAWLDSTVLWYASGLNTSAQITEIMLTNNFPAEYVPFGYEVDMSVKSANLWDSSAIETGGISVSDGANVINSNHYRTKNYIDVLNNKSYTLTGANGKIRVYSYDMNGFLDSILLSPGDSFNSNNAVKIRFAGLQTSFTNVIMLNEGSTPLPYQPYSNTTTPIYIGDTPLGEDEYVSFKEQKRVRFVPIIRVSTAPYNSPATIVFLTPAKDSFVVQSGSTQRVYESADINPEVQGHVRFRCLINAEKFSSMGRLLVGIRDKRSQFIKSVRVEKLGKTYIDFDANDIPENSYISIMATDGRTNAGTYKYTVIGAEIQTSAPTDPPVPLPALPMVDGINVVDYAGQSAAPSRFYAKYRKEGFN